MAMTHDELLAKIDEQITTRPSGEYGWPKQWLPDEVKPKTSTVAFFKALRAVVELHKPILYSHYSDELMCNKCIGIQYPCSTIQAIEKELQ